MGLKFRIEVGAKPDEVFGYLADLSRHGEWGTGGLKVERISDGPVGVGSKFRSTQRFAGKPSGAELTMREFDPPREFVFAADQGLGPKKQTFIHTWTFTPSGSGTLVVHDVTRENASPLAALGIIFYPAIKADAMKGLRAMKAKVEAGAG